MNLSRKIAAALDESRGAGTVAVQDGPYRLELHVQEAGRVGVSFSALEFAAGDHREWSSEALKAWGDSLCARVTYLMEPLVVLEVDPVGGEVELRSEAPTARHRQRAFYEIRLDRKGTLRLSRVIFDEENRERRPVSCQLTCEVLERLTDDLVASVA
jgi:hypothetical protein